MQQNPIETYRRLSASSRRDKYQRHIKEYWIEKCTRGNYNKTEEEAWAESVSGEGNPGDGFNMGAINPDALGEGSDAGDSTEPDEDEEPKGRSKGKTSRKSKPSKQKNDLEEEAALEACPIPTVVHCEIKLPTCTCKARCSSILMVSLAGL